MHVRCCALVNILTRLPQSTIIRNYSRKIIRKPINVLSNEEAKEMSRSKGKARKILDHEDIVRAPIKTEFGHEVEDSNENLPKYEKLSEYDPKFTKIMMNVKSKKSRENSDKILLEGKRLIMDAIKAGASLQTIYFSHKDNLRDIAEITDLGNVPIYRIMHHHLKVWSDLTTCPGIMGIFKHPEVENLTYNRTTCFPINIICDNIREPGNLGVVVRCAAGVGCQKVILTKGCVDVWNQKVIRSGAGAHFRIPIVSNVGWETLENYCAPECDVILADSTPKSGIKDSSTIDNLKNVMAHELQQEEQQDDGYEVDNTGSNFRIDTNYQNEARLKFYKSIGIASQLYTDINVDENRETNIVVGGETEGLSGSAYRFAHKHHGTCAHIPMENDVESLNCAIASGIILYDVRRKLTEAKATPTKKLLSTKI